MREIAPVHFHPLLGMPVAVSHAACSELLRGRDLGRIWVDKEPAAAFPAFNLLHRNSLLRASRTTGCARWSRARSTAATPHAWRPGCAGSPGGWSTGSPSGSAPTAAPT